MYDVDSTPLMAIFNLSLSKNFGRWLKNRRQKNCAILPSRGLIHFICMHIVCMCAWKCLKLIRLFSRPWICIFQSSLFKKCLKFSLHNICYVYILFSLYFLYWEFPVGVLDQINYKLSTWCLNNVLEKHNLILEMSLNFVCEISAWTNARSKGLRSKLKWTTWLIKWKTACTATFTKWWPTHVFNK